jgi:hypothetical protein
MKYMGDRMHGPLEGSTAFDQTRGAYAPDTSTSYPS